MLCGSLAWLNSVSTLPEDYSREGAKETKETQSSMTDFPSWLLDITDEDVVLSLFLPLVFTSRGKAGESAFPVRATEKAIATEERAKVAATK